MPFTITSLRWPAAAWVLAVSPLTLAHHEYRSTGPAYMASPTEYAPVTHVEPIVRHVRVSTPRQECWQTPVHHVERHNDHTTGRTLLGGIIGAAIGHQIGSGRGNDAATVVGGLAGAAIGANSAQADAYEESYTTYEDQCRTTYSHHQEERIEGYEVTYQYGGRSYQTTTREHPGKHIPVHVQVRPAY